MVINLNRYRWAFISIALLLGAGCLALVMCANYNQLEQTPAPQNKSIVEHGQYISWKEVNRLFPRYTKATITDFESKKSFKVQRRAGSSHADVQPLTAGDTAMMKDIYNGHWSWRRRAVILTLADGRKIAASMAGMPHGAGAIRGNRFNGHFCLHFRESTTHGSGQVDPAHQMMIWKSAGILDKKLGVLPARQIIIVFFTALGQGDKTITCRMASPADMPGLIEDIDFIESISIDNIEEYSSHDYRVSLRVQYAGDHHPAFRTGSVLLPSSEGGLIDYSSLRPWLMPPKS